MRADRLISRVLLLRQHGLLTAGRLARELEVSTRTVLRDLEALSASGVPVYAERGRHGGFALLPGFGTELSGLTQEEALALLIAGSRRAEHGLGLGSALASAVRKVVGALPAGRRDSAADAARRLLIDPEVDFIAPRTAAAEPTVQAMAVVRRAVLNGHKLRIHYTASGQNPSWRTVDPLGLVMVQGRAYLLATKEGADRTYRFSRVSEAEELNEPAQRSSRVDLERLWRERCAQYLSDGEHVTVSARVHPARRDDLVSTALAVRADDPEPGGWLRLEMTFPNAQHAEFALWDLAADAEALAPQELRAALRERAAAISDRYAQRP